VLVVTRYAVPVAQAAEFRDLAAVALDTLVGRPGCQGGRLGRAVDDPELWTLTTTWDSVGSYRRALSSYEVKLHVVPLMYRAVDEPTAFEDLLTWTPDGGRREHEPALAADAGQVSLGEAGTPRAPRALD
jgi:quinol monooxygenase YgiN